MNRYVMDYLESKMGEDGRRRRSRRTGRYVSDRSMDRRDYEDERDYMDERDHRRGRDYDDERDYRRDRNDYGYQEKLELTKSDMHEWKQKLRNADGSKGAHYEMQQIIQTADKVGIKFKEYDEKEFCMVVNMLYSDYCTVINKFVPHDKSLMLFVEMARAFLEDDDAPEGSEKLALYYHCVVCSEEV